MMIIVPKSRAHKRKRGGEGGIWKNLRGMVQPSQQHVAPCVKGIEWGLGTRGLRMVAAYWAGMPVEVVKTGGRRNPTLKTRCHWHGALAPTRCQRIYSVGSKKKSKKSLIERWSQTTPKMSTF